MVDDIYKRSAHAALLASLALLSKTSPASAQQTTTPSADERIDELSHEVQDLKALVHQLQDLLSRMSGAPG